MMAAAASRINWFWLSWRSKTSCQIAIDMKLALTLNIPRCWLI